MLLNNGFKSIFLNINFLLRASSAAIKFLFVIFLANFESASLVGEYALLATISAIFIQIIGFDVTTVVGRALHKTDRRGKFKLLIKQYSIYAGSYLFFSILIFFSFYVFVGKEIGIAVFFMLIVLLEHFFTEVFRTFVSLVKVKVATIIQFIKTVPYIVFLILFSYISNEDITIENIIFSWFINLFLVFVFFAIYFIKEISFRNLKFVFVGFIECKEILSEAIPYFLVIIFGVLFSNIDKLIIGKYLGNELLGIYFTYFTICSVLSLLISFTVGVKQGPIAIKIFSEKGGSDYLLVRKNLIRDYVRVLIFGGMVIVFVGSIYLIFIENETKIENYITFILLFFSVVFLSLSQPFKLDLCLLKNDVKIVFAFLSSLILNLIILYLLIQKYNIVGAALASAISSLYMLISFYYMSKRALCRF